MGNMSDIDTRGDATGEYTNEEGLAFIPPVILYDRRKSPDRRKTWRGGRRDSDWLHRPPGALRRFEKLQRRVVQVGKWRVPVPFTGSGRRVHPFLGLWALAIAAILTFAVARTNFVLLQVLFERMAPDSPPRSAPAGETIRDV
jgi:hypothetical protein